MRGRTQRKRDANDCKGRPEGASEEAQACRHPAFKLLASRARGNKWWRFKPPGVPWWLKESACQCRRPRFSPWRFPQRRKWQPSAVFVTGKSMDTGVWRATIHEVAQTWARLSDETTTHHQPPSRRWLAVAGPGNQQDTLAGSFLARVKG